MVSLAGLMSQVISRWMLRRADHPRGKPCADVDQNSDYSEFRKAAIKMDGLDKFAWELRVEADK